MSRDMRYWFTPPELYRNLNAEFRFDFDPCPAQSRLELQPFDGLGGDWNGRSIYLNPPFTKEAGGPTRWVRKAIEQNKKGKAVVLTLPTSSYVNLLLEAGAELRSLGRVKWISAVDGSAMPQPGPTTLFILRAKAAQKRRMSR